jgi:hypothetical protein
MRLKPWPKKKTFQVEKENLEGSPKRRKRKLIGWRQNIRKEELRFSVSAGATF